MFRHVVNVTVFDRITWCKLRLPFGWQWLYWKCSRLHFYGINFNSTI